MTTPPLSADRSFRRLVAAGLSVAVMVLLGASDADAAKRIHFKNGHVLEVQDFRVDGETVRATLRDGSEVGFPSMLIENTEDSAGFRRVAPSRSGAGSAFASWEDQPSVRQSMNELGIAERYSGRRNDAENVVAVGTVAGGKGRQTVGYNYRGQSRADDPRTARAMNQSRQKSGGSDAERRGGTPIPIPSGMLRAPKIDSPWLVLKGQTVTRDTSGKK